MVMPRSFGRQLSAFYAVLDELRLNGPRESSMPFIS